MKRFIFKSSGKGLICVILLLNIVNPAHGEEKKLKVVATLPVLRNFVEEIGQDRVMVSSLLTGLESEHTYTPKPGDILAIKKAQILVQIGLGLEVWVQALIANSDNSDLLILTTSHGIPLIRDEESSGETEELQQQDRGNPHIWLDPENAKSMVRQITDALIKKDPSGKEFYLKNQGIYLRKLDVMETTLLNELKTLRHKTILTQHPAWPYFARRFGFKVAGNLLIQTGSEPSARELKDLISLINREKIKVLVTEPQLSDKIPRILASETKIKLITLSPLPGAIPGTETYLSLIEYNVHHLINGLRD